MVSGSGVSFELGDKLLEELFLSEGAVLVVVIVQENVPGLSLGVGLVGANMGGKFSLHVVVNSSDLCLGQGAVVIFVDCDECSLSQGSHLSLVVAVTDELKVVLHNFPVGVVSVSAISLFLLLLRRN